jgi:hypothetical protein
MIKLSGIFFFFFFLIQKDASLTGPPDMGMYK